MRKVALLADVPDWAFDINNRDLEHYFSDKWSFEHIYVGDSATYRRKFEEFDMLYIAMGTVEGDAKCPPGFHQFVGSKAPWFEICDDLPQHDGWPLEE